MHRYLEWHGYGRSWNMAAGLARHYACGIVVADAEVRICEWLLPEIDDLSPGKTVPPTGKKAGSFVTFNNSLHPLNNFYTEM